jgi:probable phosphoglycerate mutase
MRIIFVRHGHPDYKNDCLTPLGHKQAEAAAKRLAEEKIDAIFSSSCGRAAETAEYIARDHGMKVELLDFMREISWGPRNGEELYKNGHPWRTVEKITNESHSLLSTNWGEEDYFNKNIGVEKSENVITAFDAWLSELGYTGPMTIEREISGPEQERDILAAKAMLEALI